VAALAWSPDGETLASGGPDRVVRLWSIAAGAEVAALEGHSGPIQALAFSPAGDVLASGGRSARGAGEVLLWRASPLEQGAAAD
jgi:WD40 repeat protein